MKEKILVVDDDKSMVNMIKDVLEMEGYAVTTAFDGEQALKQVQKQSDIILLDINLPKIPKRQHPIHSLWLCLTYP